MNRFASSCSRAASPHDMIGMSLCCLAMAKPRTASRITVILMRSQNNILRRVNTARESGGGATGVLIDNGVIGGIGGPELVSSVIFGPFVLVGNQRSC